MVMSARRPCSAAGCPGYQPCPTHARQRERVRNATQDRAFYNLDRWVKLRQWFRGRYPLCGMRCDGVVHHEHRRPACQARGDVLAECVDHIVPVTKGGDKVLRRQSSIAVR